MSFIYALTKIKYAKKEEMHSNNFYHLKERQFITIVCVHAYFSITEFYVCLGNINAPDDGRNLINVN